MYRGSLLKILFLTLLLTLVSSVVFTTHAAADDGTPPPSDAPAVVPSEPGSTHAGDLPAMSSDPASDDAAALPTTSAGAGDVPAATEDVSQPPAEPAVQAEAVSPANAVPAPDGTDASSEAAAPGLAQLPTDTPVVLLNEEGQSVPLASQEAAQIVAGGDPTWCPTGVTPGAATCHPYGSLQALVADVGVAFHPAANGVIWIENTTFTGPATVSFDGGTAGDWSAWANFSLTLKGGWTGTGTNISGNTILNNIGLSITGWNGDITLSDIEIKNVSSGFALQITTNKKITLTRVNVHGNAGGGTVLENCNWSTSVTPNRCLGTGAISITSSQFDSNSNSYGLDISANGPITLSSVTANSNTGLGGLRINNCQHGPTGCMATGAVTITSSRFNSNSGGTGLDIYSNGVITLNSVIANGNHAANAYLVNDDASTAVGVTLTGMNTWDSVAGTFDNTFNGSGVAEGVYIRAKGAVAISNLTADDNSSWGANIDNCNWSTAVSPNRCLGSGAVTMTGTNLFNHNWGGLTVTSNGAISLSNLVAESNTGGNGVELYNGDAAAVQPVTLSGTNQLRSNHTANLYIETRGNILLNNLTANSSPTSYGAILGNCEWSGSGCLGTGTVTLTGTNFFQDNALDGLDITSAGAVSMSNVNASWNGILGSITYGASIDNCALGFSTCTRFVPVSLTGTNVFEGNRTGGLYIRSGGAITVNNINASNNIDSYGAHLENAFDLVTGGITVTGLNTFNRNGGDGLYASSRGAISVASTTALYNGTVAGSTAKGLTLTNADVIGKSITLSGTNVLNGNTGWGLSIASAGQVTINNLTANYNGHYAGGGTTTGCGAQIENTASPNAGVTFTGVNVLNSNFDWGLYIVTHGPIALNNVTASHNYTFDGVSSYYGNSGAYLYNRDAALPQAVTLTGTNQFSDNHVDGLSIATHGAVTLNNTTANDNMTSYGMYVDNCDWDIIGHKCKGTTNIALNGANQFVGNWNVGLSIQSGGAMTLANVTASSNGQGFNGEGARLDNCGIYGSTCSVVNKSISLTGINLFNNNTGGGLNIGSSGAISLSNVTANGTTNGDGVRLVNEYASATAGVTVSGVNVFNENNANGLYIYTNGAVQLWNLTAAGNGAGGGNAGVYVWNETGVGKAVTLNGSSSLSRNKGNNLEVVSAGTITIANLTSVGSLDGSGARLSTIYSVATTNSVVLSGTNAFNDNDDYGLVVYADGMLTINNLTANGNGYTGAYIDNRPPTVLARNVSLTGYGLFNDNHQSGLQIYSYGAINIMTSSLVANRNGIPTYGYGVYLDNCSSGSTCVASSSVNVNGVNQMNGNRAHGLYIDSGGAVTVSNVTATCNGMANDCATALDGADGLEIYNDHPLSGKPAVILTGVNVFNRNRNNGLQIFSAGAITVNNVTANYNLAGIGGRLENDYFGSTGSIVLNGTSTFNGNGGYGLNIDSMGAITVGNLTASWNGSDGAELGNYQAGASGSITLTGINSFNGNLQDGLRLDSRGAITASNVTANHNAAWGASLYNNYGSAPVPPALPYNITLTGVNQFSRNGSYGLYVETYGVLSLARVSAGDNGSEGLRVGRAGQVNIVCGAFTHNTAAGMSISNASSVLLSGVFSFGNGPSGTTADYFGAATVTRVRTCPLP